MSENSNKIIVKGRVWLDVGENSFLGQGKIELIEKIKEFGSLRKAAMEMKMSYQKAWFNVDEMNKAAGKPLVILKRGGKDGGIAQITEAGEKALKMFKQLQNDFKKFVEEKSENLEL
jgi:molybdate transport system regulatory protein